MPQPLGQGKYIIYWHIENWRRYGKQAHEQERFNDLKSPNNLKRGEISSKHNASEFHTMIPTCLIPVQKLKTICPRL